MNRNFLILLRFACIVGLVISPVLFIYGAIKVSKVQNLEDQFVLDGNLSITEPIDEEVAKAYVGYSMALLPVTIFSLILVQRAINRTQDMNETDEHYSINSEQAYISRSRHANRVNSQGPKLILNPQSQKVLAYFRSHRHKQISWRQLTESSFAHREGLTSQHEMMAALSPLLDTGKIGETADGDYYLTE